MSKKIILLLLLAIVALFGYLMIGWKGVFIISPIFLLISILSELLYWKKARKKGNNDLIDVINNLLNRKST